MTDEPLPTVVTVSNDFMTRLPAQRFMDELARLEPGINFAELSTQMPFRLTAFRALVRDFPGYDPTALWLHSYDVEVAVVEPDPFNGKSPTPGPPFAATGTASPNT